VRAVSGAEMVAPDLLNVEVLSTLRRLEQLGAINAGRAAQAISDLVRAPLRRLPTRSLVADMWSVRANVSAYDACYVALARALRCPLVTGDARLARAPGLGITTLVI
jgi:predicted nucleic acid-binding protein